MIKKITSLLTILVLTVIAQTINAAPNQIVIDPGSVGPMPVAPVSRFTELDGRSFDGSLIELDFIFTDMKHLEAPASLA